MGGNARCKATKGFYKLNHMQAVRLVELRAFPCYLLLDRDRKLDTL